MTKKGIKASDVFKLATGLRILVKVNEYGQPIRAARRVLTRYMTKLVRQPNLCPPDMDDFNAVKNVFGVELLRVVREKFCFPPHENVDNVLIALFGTKFRNNKYKLRKKIFDDAKARVRAKLKVHLERCGIHGEELGNQVKSYAFQEAEIETEIDEMEAPPGFANHQWLKFKSDMKSDKIKELSRKGKDARATQAHVHTTGTKSYAQVEDEYVVKNKKRPGLVKLFEITHTQKDGSFVQDESREFMTTAASEIDELRAMGSYENEQELESAVWYKLMGEDRPGRARGYGTGVTKSQVTGFRAQIKRMRSEEANRNHPNVQMQKLEMLLAQQQEMMNTYMARTNETIANLKDEVQIYRTAFGSFDLISSTRVSNPQDSRGLNENDAHNTSPNGSGAND